MKTIIHIVRSVAILGLVMILTCSILYAKGTISKEGFKILILCCSLFWFIAILISNLLKTRRDNPENK